MATITEAAKRASYERVPSTMNEARSAEVKAAESLGKLVALYARHTEDLRDALTDAEQEIINLEARVAELEARVLELEDQPPTPASAEKRNDI